MVVVVLVAAVVTLLPRCRCSQIYASNKRRLTRIDLSFLFGPFGGTILVHLVVLACAWKGC